MTDTHKAGNIVAELRSLRTAIAVIDREAAAAAHLREGDLTVLDVLHREGAQTPTALAHRTRTHVATMTGVLARLERDGWIERRADATDRRSLGVHPTSVERFRDLYAAPNARLAELFAGWADERAEEFLAAVRDVVRVLEERRES